MVIYGQSKKPPEKFPIFQERFLTLVQSSTCVDAKRIHRLVNVGGRLEIDSRIKGPARGPEKEGP
jgi:hypothetical protein